MASDANYKKQILGLKPDNTVAPVKVSSSGELVVEFVPNGSTNQLLSSKRDDNYKNTAMGEYSSTPYAINVDSSGQVVTNGITIS